MPQYIALLRKDPDSDFGVDFPDFPGCITAGETLDEARRMAHEALRFHAEEMLKDGEELPDPSELDEIMEDPDHHDAVAFLVDVPEPTPKTVRVNITLPEPALQRIDDYASGHGMSRSAFLVKAAGEMIGGRVAKP